MTRVYDADQVYFISDTHFFHKNIIKYENRKYLNMKLMNQEIINKWNKQIPENGIVFHLGDFALANKTQWVEILNQLNGKIILIKGNHDKSVSSKFLEQHFYEVYDYLEIKLRFYDEEIPVVLFHYPLYSWNKQPYGAWHLFGHVHSRFSTIPNVSHNFNVSYDNIHNLISANQLAAYFYEEYKQSTNFKISSADFSESREN